MSNFEIISQNLLNTTSLISISSGTDSVSYLFDRDSNVQWQSVGENSSTMVVSITVKFPSAKVIDRVVIQNINLKDWSVKGAYNTIFYDWMTITSANTTIANWESNSDTSVYLKFLTALTLTAIEIKASSTMDASEEKKIGQIWIGEKQFTFANNPTAKDYKAKIDRRKVSHEMSDGGNTVYVFGDSFQTNLKLKYQSDTMRDNLKTLYDTRQPFVFIPYPTGTSWEGNEIYEVNWDGDFDFRQPAGNDYDSLGWSGSMMLKETPK